MSRVRPAFTLCVCTRSTKKCDSLSSKDCAPLSLLERARERESNCGTAHVVIVIGMSGLTNHFGSGLFTPPSLFSSLFVSSAQYRPLETFSTLALSLCSSCLSPSQLSLSVCPLCPSLGTVENVT